MICYRSKLEPYQSEDGIDYLSYSLIASENGHDLKKIDDVSMDRDIVLELLDILNEENVPVSRFFDVVVENL